MKHTRLHILFLGAVLMGAFVMGLPMARAQQQPVTTLPLAHMYDAHPAAAGADSLIHVSLWQRSPWTGLPSAPRTTSLALTSPTSSKSLSWGARVWSDVAGPTRMSGAHAGMVYSAQWTRKMRMSLGLGVGWTQFSIDGNRIELEQAGDPTLEDIYQAVGVPDATAGLLLTGGEFRFAVSAGHVLGSSLPVYEGTGLDSRLTSHMRMLISNRFNRGQWGITPVVQVQHLRPIPTEWALALRVDRDKSVWAMAGYRSAGAGHFGAGMRINDQLTFSYNRNWAMGSLARVLGGGHEVVLGFTVPR